MSQDRIVGDDSHAASVLMHFLKKAKNGLTRLEIEIPGGLVGKYQHGGLHQGSCNRYSLLFTP